MATTTRQSSLLVNQDWTKLYQAFREADFQSYDFQTLRKTMIDYLRTYYPEDFNDFIESSEYVALIDLIAFLGQSLAYRTDLNARENFIDTAERRDSVLKLARLISYNPKRNICASGFLKVASVSTTETIYDSNGIDLTNVVINWNDSANINWYEQFTSIVNASLVGGQVVGKPSNSQSIGGIDNSEYQINLLPTTLPVFKFSTSVENTTLPFEIVSATSVGQSYVYEIPPRPSRSLGFLYKNDGLGNDSNNTGFFFMFKQGTLDSQDFVLQDSLPNRVVSVNQNNINNSDIWLYGLNSNRQLDTIWDQVPAVNGVNVIYNNSAARNIYQVNSRSEDQVDLVFGDGTFSAIPLGSFRAYYRQSVGLTYKITPSEMQSIIVPISYVSHSGRIETITFTVNLHYTVANAVSRESLAEIRSKAPQQYYTQNRMITGEDYNIFPYTNFNSVSKVKAVNRTSSGVSRFLDVVDTTGKYSSTNIFAQDGYLYREDSSANFNFTWTTTQEINRVFLNQVNPAIRDQKLTHFYYANYPRYDLTGVYWKEVTADSGVTTGYFVGSDGTAMAVGNTVNGNQHFLSQGAILVVTPGAGKYFDEQNEIKPLPASGIMPLNGKSVLYASISRLVNDGTDILSDGTGPVVLSLGIASGAVIAQVIPSFSNEISSSLVSTIISYISTYRNFGLRYDVWDGEWRIIDGRDLNLTAPFSLPNSGDTSGQNLDSSWLISFVASGLVYTTRVRGLSYLFESAQETKFYFDKSVKVYDSKTGLTVNDSVKVLKVNGSPVTGAMLETDVTWYVDNLVIEPDGYVDNSKIQVTFADSDNNGIPDNPDIFELIVNTDTASIDRFVFFKKEYGYGGFERLIPIDKTLIDREWMTLSNLLPNLGEYSEGQIWYMVSEDAFYVGKMVNNTLTPVRVYEYAAKVGRSDLYFQYRHNSPNYRRIDPSPNNIIDLYFLTKTYESEYRAWALDNTGKVSKPVAPNSEELRIQFAELEKYKGVSDAIVYNTAKFKPLFGSKAEHTLQATFKVIKNTQYNISDSEVKSQVLALINSYFATNNWDFGETFYFSELSAYLHAGLAPIISSIVIVPNDVNEAYGSLQQIVAGPDEILISTATVDNIEIISTITAAQLNVQNQVVNTIIT